jgi:hypothetical protein
VNGPRMPATSPRPCCSTTRRVSNSATTEFFQSGGSRASVSQVSGFPELRHQGVIGIVRWSSGKEGEVATLDDLVHLLDPALDVEQSLGRNCESSEQHRVVPPDVIVDLWLRAALVDHINPTTDDLVDQALGPKRGERRRGCWRLDDQDDVGVATGRTAGNGTEDSEPRVPALGAIACRTGVAASRKNGRMDITRPGRP